MNETARTLTTDGVESDSKWTWLTDKWPWEGEM